jgi:hypothetical protein
MGLLDGLVVDEMCVEDAVELVRLAGEWGMPWFEFSAGGCGAVVRDGVGGVVAFTVVRDRPYGLVVDELWCNRGTLRGRAGLSLLAEWLELLAQRIADERGVVMSLGGLVRLGNESHKAMLEHRGYVVVAEALSKEFVPRG